MPNTMTMNRKIVLATLLITSSGFAAVICFSFLFSISIPLNDQYFASLRSDCFISSSAESEGSSPEIAEAASAAE